MLRISWGRVCGGRRSCSAQSLGNARWHVPGGKEAFVLNIEDDDIGISSSAQQSDQDATYLDLFEEQRVGGILIAPVGNVLPRLRRLKRNGISVVIIDRKAGADELSSVSVDDERGGWLAADHLIAQGARRIGVIGGPGNLRQVRQRLRGAQQRVKQTTSVNVEFLDSLAMDTAAGRRVTEELVKRPRSERPDALFATNDLVALGALQVLARTGTSVPHDMLLVGYDDIEFAASATIPISSVRQPSAQMGQHAAELLQRAMSEPDSPVEHTVFQPELIARESTLDG